MNDHPLLSVIVPVYNAEAYLPKCLDSILNQTYDHLEVIVIDDGSQDGSCVICDRYAWKDSRVRVIHRENAGQAAARNQALQLCRGEYVTFCDSDDWLEKNAYQEMLEALQKTGAGVACCGRYNAEEASGEKTLGLCPKKSEILSKEEMLVRMFTWQDCDCSPCDKVFKRSLFEQVRFPEKSGSEDVAILYKLIILGERTVMVPKPFYNYLQRQGSTSYGTVNEKTFQYEFYTRQLYRDICRDLPEVIPAARFLRVRSLARPVLLLDQADGETRRKYADRCSALRRELRSHLGFLLTGPYFGKQERITNLLLCLDLYRILRKFVHREE